ncbi:helix-turn-helix transcriptional regulator [Streptomyces sp. NPDC006267]|uniref:helix-turn-helix domain-containing protein n=1 Tax=Streptomyces sp. NPDC006267 TaxID=3157173 RepID=UPI0033B1D7BF
MNRDPHAWARLGQKLKATRLARGLKQSDIAEEASVSLASVQSAEAGTMPKSRMPITLPPIAAALGWRQGSVDAVLDGGEPDLEPADSEWRDVSVQQQIDEEQLAGIMTNSMVRAMKNTPSGEIRAATRIALDELRRQGYLPETNSVQPSTISENP